MSDELLPTLLIVDDSETTRAMIKRIIRMIDPPIANLCEAANGAEAMQKLETLHIDLVLADLNMPVMDGFEMIARMRQHEALRSIPVVVISAQPDPDEVIRLKQNGVAAYLPKPFTAEGVRNIVVPLLKASKDPEPSMVSETSMESFNLTLAEALAGALETMAFITPELVSGPTAPPLPDGARLVRIHFKGHDTEGSLALAASPGLGDAMAANLDVAHASASDDALKELANVTCGLLLRMRPGGGVGFHLDPPEMSSSPETTPARIFKGGDLVTLQAEGHIIAAQVVTDAAFYGF